MKLLLQKGMGDLKIRLSRKQQKEIDYYRQFADGKSRTQEQFILAGLDEFIDTLKNNPERLERGLRKLIK